MSRCLLELIAEQRYCIQQLHATNCMHGASALQGTHTAMKSGMLAADAAFDALTAGAGAGAAVDLSAYEPALRESWVCEELEKVRNIRPGCAPLGGEQVSFLCAHESKPMTRRPGSCSQAWPFELGLRV